MIAKKLYNRDEMAVEIDALKALTLPGNRQSADL